MPPRKGFAMENSMEEADSKEDRAMDMTPTKANLILIPTIIKNMQNCE